MAIDSKQIRQRLVIAVFAYLAYTTLFSADTRRNLSSDVQKTALEFVHITHTGGQAIEKVAATKGLKWGACHYLSVVDCGSGKPEYEYDDNLKTSYFQTNKWHLPPRDTGVFTDDENPNSFSDLFTVVRNPYSRTISEFYSPYAGYENALNNNAEEMNKWILSTLEGFELQRTQFAQKVEKNQDSLLDIVSPEFLSSKHLKPQVEYVYDIDGTRLVKNVLHFEDLGTEFDSLMEQYGLDVDPPEDDDKDTRGSLGMKDLYAETIAKINELYAADFEAFAYTTISRPLNEEGYERAAQSLPCKSFKMGDTECNRDIPPTTFNTDGEISIGVTHSTTFLLGIFTNMTSTGAEERARIRSTYLDTTNKNVCKLSEYIKQKEEQMIIECRMPYVFVVGGNDSGPNQHTDNSKLEIDSEDADNSTDEGDIVYLNIAESTTSGKSVSFFKWAGEIGTKLQFDFIGKVASTTLLDMDLLIDFVDLDLPATPFNRRMYGGSAWGYYWEGGYFGTSAFYFMSLDLAEYIGRVRFDWTREEAHDVGRFIFKHEKPIKFVNMNPRLLWFEGITTDDEWMNNWHNKMGQLPLKKPNMENHKICQSFKDEGLFTG